MGLVRTRYHGSIIFHIVVPCFEEGKVPATTAVNPSNGVKIMLLTELPWLPYFFNLEAKRPTDMDQYGEPDCNSEIVEACAQLLRMSAGASHIGRPNTWSYIARIDWFRCFRARCQIMTRTYLKIRIALRRYRCFRARYVGLKVCLAFQSNSVGT
jgi:hypothetical protein